MRRWVGTSMPKSAALKSLTSAATLTLKSAVSNLVMGPTPQTPPLRLSQKAGRLLPTGEITPMPVMTTRFIENSS